MSIIPHIHGDFHEALLLLSEAEPILTKYNQNRFLVNLYNKKCDIYEQLKQNKNALVYAVKAIELSKKMNNYENLVRSYYTYAANSDDSKKNIEYLNIAYQFILKYKMPDWLLYYYHFNYGGELCKLKQYDKALKSYQKAIEFAFDMREKMGTSLAISRILIDKKQYSKADFMLDTLLLTATKLDLKIQKRDIYNQQITLDSISGNYKNAFFNLLLKNTLNDSILTFENKKHIDYLNAKFEATQREATIQQLNADKSLKDIQLRNRNIIISAVLLGMLLLVLAMVFIYKNQKKKRLIAIQQIEKLKSEKQLEATQAVLRGETSERTRIARDLHDGLGGLLSGTKLILNNMKGNVVLTEANLSHFDHALSLLDNSITELRRVAYNMMPENLLHFGLNKALSEFCNGLNSGNGCSIRFSFFGLENRFEIDSEIIAFRVAQELINNALKYAKATEINVQLVQDPNRVSLTVQDNGIGFNVEQVDENKSSGLRNIRSRIDSLQGQFSINSEPNQGTEVTIEFNIKI